MSTPSTNHATSVPIPLPPAAHEYAKTFAAEQPTPEKGRRVYLGTLAVYAFNTYLRCLQVETDLENSDSWSWPHAAVSEGADLDLPGIGKLVCCPVFPGADYFIPPSILLPDQIVYIAVQFKDVLDAVELIGYRPILDPEHPPEKIYVDDLQTDINRDNSISLFPIENLVDYLSYVKVVRKGLKDSEQPFLTGVRQILEKQNRSLAQVAVQAIYEVSQSREAAWGRRGEQLLIGASSVKDLSTGQRNTLSMTLGDSNQEPATMTDEHLRSLGSQFLHWVKSSLNRVTD